MDSISLLKDNDKRGTVGQSKTLTVKKFFNGKPPALNGGTRSKKTCCLKRYARLQKIVICCGSKNSSKLLLSRFQLIDGCHRDSSIEGRDFTEVIILS